MEPEKRTRIVDEHGELVAIRLLLDPLSLKPTAVWGWRSPDGPGFVPHCDDCGWRIELEPNGTYRHECQRFAQ